MNQDLQRTVEDTFKELPSDDKHKYFLTRLKQLAQRDVVDVLDTNQALVNVFLKNPSVFGSGYSETTSGIADVKEFSTDGSNRYPTTRLLLKDYTQDITNEFGGHVRVTVNQVDMMKYFNSWEQMEKWVQLNYKRPEDTFNLWMYNYLKGIFGGTVDTDILEKSHPLYADIAKIKAEMKNKQEYTTPTKGNDTEALVKKIIEVYNYMLLEPSDKFHADPAIKGFYVTTKPENMVLVWSAGDKLTLENEILASTYNPNYLQLPQIQTLTLNIPKGTAYLLDKRALQISLKYSSFRTQELINTEDTDIVVHKIIRTGLFKLYNCVIITKQTSSPEAA